MANAILTGRFIGKIYTEYRREFVEHFQYGKQIGKRLDQQNTQTRPQAPKPIFLGLISENLKIRLYFLDILKNILNLLTDFLWRLDHTLSQTSSCGSELKQNRFGGKFKITVKMQS